MTARLRPRPVAHLYLMHAHSPIHAGVGEGTGAINLPIARERATGLPLVPGSSVKGVLRDLAESTLDPNGREIRTAFGPPAEDAGANRGGLVFTDALLLALPVRSLYGTFAWVTAPEVLRRLSRDLDEAGVKLDGLAAVLAGEGTRTTTDTVLMPDGTLYLEELAFGEAVKPDAQVTALGAALAAHIWPEHKAGQAFFTRRLCVVDDDDFGFLHQVATEVRTRVKIDDTTGTAATSGPWSEEYLPTESLLFGLVLGRVTAWVKPAAKDEGTDSEGTPPSVEPSESLELLTSLLEPRPVLRFGGKSTVGAGRARIEVVARREASR